MDIILIALAFIGGLTGLIIVGMIITMYFYSHDALGPGYSRGAHGLRTLTGRSVPVQVTTGAGQSDINLGLSTDPGARYVRGGMIVTAMFLLLIVVVIILILSASLPK
jgi:heme A synthase